MKKIGKFICCLRKENELTQKELAKKVSYSHQLISKWEKGSGVPDTDTIPRLACALGVTTDELLNGERTPVDTQMLVYEENESDSDSVGELLYEKVGKGLLRYLSDDVGNIIIALACLIIPTLGGYRLAEMLFGMESQGEFASMPALDNMGVPAEWQWLIMYVVLCIVAWTAGVYLTMTLDNIVNRSRSSVRIYKGGSIVAAISTGIIWRVRRFNIPLCDVMNVDIVGDNKKKIIVHTSYKSYTIPLHVADHDAEEIRNIIMANSRKS